MKMVKFPSIEQFRTVVKNVQHRSAYVGMSEDGEVIMDRCRKAPILRFSGTVKLHGTNAAVGVDFNNEIWFQSRENIITPDKDNAGFAMFAYSKNTIWQDIATNVVSEWCKPGDTFKSADSFTYNKDVLIFGEWCGGNIQKGVAITGLPKMFVIFGIALVDSEGQKTYLTREQVEHVVRSVIGATDRQIYCIYEFQTFDTEIDFENPHLIQNELNKLTELVGDICPVGKAFGVTEGCTTGEGIVWRCIEEGYEDSGYWFKVKDDRHSNSKVKTLAMVDVQRIDSIKELAEQLANNGRLMQVCQTTFNLLNDGTVDVKRTGEFIKNVMADIFKEDIDIIAASGFTGKDLNSPIAKICRDFLLNSLT